MKLTKRMETILSVADRTDTLADIGCDHGKITIAALQRGVANRAFATDISKPSLKKAEILAQAMGYADRVVCKAGDGLAPIRNEAVTAAMIAGMGGMLVCDILEQGKDVAKRLDYIILSPNTDIEHVRMYLSAEFEILDEKLCFEEGHYYFILKIRYGNGFCYSKEELAFGRHLLRRKDAVLLQYLQYRLKIEQNILQKLTAAGVNTLKSQKIIEQLKEVITWF